MKKGQTARAERAEAAAVKAHMALARAEAGCPDDDTLVMHCRGLREQLAEQRRNIERALTILRVDRGSHDADVPAVIQWLERALEQDSENLPAQGEQVWLWCE